MRSLTLTALTLVLALTAGCVCPIPGWGYDQVYYPIPPTPTPVITLEPLPTRAPTPTPTPEPPGLPTGTYLKKTMDTGNGELEITNALADDAMIKVSSIDDRKDALIAVYVVADTTFTIDGIDDGTYYVFYMTGNDWNRTAGTFNDPGDFGRFEETFSFTSSLDNEYIHYSAWNITLASAGTGNSASNRVQPADFPV